MLFLLSGSLPVTAWFVAVPLLIVVPAWAAARLARAGQSAAVGIAVGVAVAVFFFLRDVRLPIPVDATPNAASSLHASAPDLARFLLELARPTLGDPGATRAMASAQQRLDGVSA